VNQNSLRFSHRNPELLYPHGAEFELGDFAVGVELVDGQQVGRRFPEVEGQEDAARLWLV
jgi:hypothetical protein